MAYYEGDTLKQRIERGALAVDNASAAVVAVDLYLRGLRHRHCIAAG